MATIRLRSFTGSRLTRLVMTFVYIMTLLLVIIMCSFLLMDPLSKSNNNEVIQSKWIQSIPSEFGVKNRERLPEGFMRFPSKVSNNKENVNYDKKPFLMIGISTVCIPRGNYLKLTIDSLLNNTSAEEKRDVQIVISVSDLNTSCSSYVISYVTQLYKAYLYRGLIHVINVPMPYYPPMDRLKRIFNDSVERVKWQSQQNIDYSFLMRYFTKKSVYYLHLEDDVTSVQGFVRKIKTYIQKVGVNWAVLEFSTLGFIGKLFHSEDLEKIASILQLYYAQMPCEDLLIHFRKLMLQKQRYVKKPTLFQRHGIHSSMLNLTRNVTDKYFHDDKKHHKGDNPPAKIWTNLQTYSDFIPELAYIKSDEKVFWAKRPHTGDVLILKFLKPQILDRLVIESGFSSKQDRIRGAILHISNTLDTQADGNTTCVRYELVGELSDGRIDVKNISKSFKKPTSCIRILITEKQDEWIVIREIAVFVVKEIHSIFISH